MGGAMSRNKGKRGEREVITYLQGVVNRVRRELGMRPLVLQRNLQQAHMGGADVFGIPGMSIEVKFHAKKQTRAWWEQALQQAGHWERAVLFYRGNNEPWTVRVCEQRWGECLVCGHLVEYIEMDIQSFLILFASWYREMINDIESFNDSNHSNGSNGSNGLRGAQGAERV